jgi:meso-butanediol dehydrogenase/(S,S)-butanediol dehydrogenase/diacetyl reductase
MTTLRDKVVIVTGGASGLGRACVKEFVDQGARVVVGDVDEEGGRALSDEFDVPFLFCDVSVASDCGRLMDYAVSRHGRINAVLSNAGVEANGSVESCDEETWDRALAVNLKGMFLVGKFAVPYLRIAGGGSILNTASVSAFWGEPGTVAYNASKGGIVALTKAMAMDHGREGIRVNCFCPGYHSTGMPQRYFAAQPDSADMTARVNRLIALNRMGRPDELARTAAFFLSDANPFITGAEIVIDGGMTAGYAWPVEQEKARAAMPSE